MIRAGVPAAVARAGLVLAHGRGGSAAGIIGLPEAAGLSGIAAIAPQAPGNSWWPTSFLAPMAQMQAPLDRGLATLREAVAGLEAGGLPRDRVWLAGFSQGGCLALEYFAREGAGLAGVFGFSAALVGVADAPGGPHPALYGHGPKLLDYAGTRSGAKVWIGLHEADPHIPLARARDSAGALERMGAEVHLEVAPGAGHGILPADLEALRDWVGQE